MFKAMAFKSLGFCMLIIIETIASADGIRCYKCNSVTHQDVCGEQFKLTSQNTSFIVGNCDYCIRYQFTDGRVYFRTCREERSLSYKLMIGTDYCHASGTKINARYCGDDLCNGAKPQLKTLLVNIIPVCLSVYFVFVVSGYGNIY